MNWFMKYLARNNCPDCDNKMEWWDGERKICRACGYEEKYGRWF
jgi:Zn ribbon nucleic-acid-binding protein